MEDVTNPVVYFISIITIIKPFFVDLRQNLPKIIVGTFQSLLNLRGKWWITSINDVVCGGQVVKTIKITFKLWFLQLIHRNPHHLSLFNRLILWVHNEYCTLVQF